MGGEERKEGFKKEEKDEERISEAQARSEAWVLLWPEGLGGGGVRMWLWIWCVGWVDRASQGGILSVDEIMC